MREKLKKRTVMIAEISLVHLAINKKFLIGSLDPLIMLAKKVPSVPLSPPPMPA